MRILLALVLSCVAFGQNPNPGYVLGPDSQPKPGIPKGKSTKYTWDKSRIFPGTSRAYSVYVPAQYDGSKPVCLMIFQDGAGYANETGGSRAPVVFDNLIAEGAMPVTIGLFVDPGVTPAATSDQTGRYSRSHEYDAIGDQYARFLIEELIPELSKQYKISTDPNDRGLAGGSSGGIASFVAAWHRPDAFRRVISYIGSYANLRGGDQLSNMVRKVEPKPLRVFMQDGSADQSIYGGWWFIENQSLAASLEYSGYDVKFVIGTEGHSGRQGSAILPEALRWLWRDYPKPIVASKGGPGSRHYVTDFLDPESDWQLVSSGHGNITATAIDKDGTLYFAGSKLYKMEGAKAVELRATPAVAGMMYGPDGRLYATRPAAHQIVADSQVIATGVNAHDIAVTSSGAVYFTDPAAKQIWMIEKNKPKRMVFQSSTNANILYPSSIRLTPDEQFLDVTDRDSRWVWSFKVEANHSLSGALAFHHLETPDESSATNALSETHDNTGHVYVATNMGIQISDPPGRVVGIIRNPEPGVVTSIVFGGNGLHTLYATINGKVYARTLRRTGTLPGVPVKQPRPQL